MIRLLLDTGMRRAELTGVKVADIDWTDNVAVVMGKGRRPRACPSANGTARLSIDISAYRHIASGTAGVVARHSGPMTDPGVYQTVGTVLRPACIGTCTRICSATRSRICG